MASYCTEVGLLAV